MFIALALLGGLIFLGLGAEWFTRGAVALAQHFNLPRRFIGLTLASLGGGLPALATLLQAAHNGSAQLALGGAIGGSLFMLLGGLGIAALAKPFSATSGMRFADSISLLIAAVATFYGLSHFAGQTPLPRWLGAAALGLAMLYALWAYRQKDRPLPHIPATNRRVHPLLTTGLAFGGLFALLLGATLLVRGTLQLNQSLNYSDFLLGFTVLSWGMVLPTLTTVVVAGFDPDIKTAPTNNLVGLALFTLIAVPGYMQVLHPFTFTQFAAGPALAMLAAAALAGMVYLRPKHLFGRAEGALFLAVYLLCLWQAFSTF
jgi:cation:H+ antiporter